MSVMKFAGVVLAIFSFLTAQADADKEQAAPPAVQVSVVTTKERPIRTWSQFSGRLQAIDYAQIRPEVAGRIVEVKFEDGQMVKAGDILFVIDPRPFEAAASRAKANFNSAKANAELAKTQFDRAEGLVKTQAIAQEMYDQRVNAEHLAQAALESAKAEVAQAELDLDRAYVKAPIAGHVSRAEITVGNLVAPGMPVLTSIVSSDGIYADFDVDEQTFLKHVRGNGHGPEEDRKIPVELTLSAGKGRTYKGTIYSFDNTINTSTGTIRARAKFGNEDQSLMPGMFVSVRMASSYEFKGILVPEVAIGSDQNKKFVYVVNNENKVVYRELELGQQVEGQRIVIAGLKAREKVIVDGIQHVRPDALVDPKDISETK